MPPRVEAGETASPSASGWMEPRSHNLAKTMSNRSLRSTSVISWASEGGLSSFAAASPPNPPPESRRRP